MPNKSKSTRSAAPTAAGASADTKVRPCVVSFRITARRSADLKAAYEKDRAMGVNSPNQLARKIINDYLAGRIVYTDPKDKLEDKEL